MKNNQRKLGAILSYIIIALNMIIGIAYTPFLTKMLGQSEYGLYSLVSTIIAYLTILDLGFGNAIIIYTTRYKTQNKKEEEQKLHGMFFIIFIIIGLIAGLIGIALFLNIDKFFGKTMSLYEIETAKKLMIILTINLVITFPFTVFKSILVAYEKFIFDKILNIINIIIKPLIMIPLLFEGYRSVSLVIVITVINITTLVLNTIYCFKKINIKFKFDKFDKLLLLEIASYSIWIFLNGIIDKINWSVDQFILGAVSGTIAVSIYAIAAQLNNMFLSFSTAISSVLLPKITQMETNKASNKEFTDIFIQTGRIQYILLALMITGFILFGKEFIELLWVGKDYSLAYLIACILMVPVTIPLIQNVGLNILQAKNKYKYRTIIFFVIALFNVGISIPLSKRYGGVGSAIGTSISLIIGQIFIMNWYYWKKIKIDIPLFWKNILKMSIPIIIVLLIGCIIKYIFVINTRLDLIIQIIIYTVLYCIFSYKFSMNLYEKDLINKPIRKILK